MVTSNVHITTLDLGILWKSMRTEYTVGKTKETGEKKCCKKGRGLALRGKNDDFFGNVQSVVSRYFLKEYRGCLQRVCTSIYNFAMKRRHFKF